MIYDDINDGNVTIRTFDSNIDPIELKWHRDLEDRLIEPLEYNDWFFQKENELPIPITGSIFIKAKEWHRVIKGNTFLKIKITKSGN